MGFEGMPHCQGCACYVTKYAIWCVEMDYCVSMCTPHAAKEFVLVLFLILLFHH